jgi:hypothetical protein
MSFVTSFVEKCIQDIIESDDIRLIEFKFGMAQGGLMLAIFAEDVNLEHEKLLRERLEKAYSDTAMRVFQLGRKREDEILTENTEWLIKKLK